MIWLKISGWGTLLVGAFNVGVGAASLIMGDAFGIANIAVGAAAWYVGNMLLNMVADQQARRRL